MIQEVPFSHLPPEGYFYSFEEYKSGVISIWLNNTRKFDYNLVKPTKTVWGFWKSKSNKFFAPINSKTIGKEVEFKNTRNYTAMQIKPSPLDAFFVGLTHPTSMTMWNGKQKVKKVGYILGVMIISQ